jgi:hypothetical protein
MRHLKGSRVKRRVVDSKDWLEDPADTLADRALMKRKMEARRRIENRDFSPQKEIDIQAERLSELIDNMR